MSFHEDKSTLADFHWPGLLCFLRQKCRDHVRPSRNRKSGIARRSSSWDGFTLFELILAITIITILSTLVVAPASKLLGGSHLSQAALGIEGQLSLARQSALTLNRMVEVRFYQFADPDAPGETAASPGTGKYRAMQAFEILDSGSAVALGKMQRLPSTVVIDSGKTLSSIMGLAQSSSSSPTVATGTALNAPIPQVGLNYNCVSFRFLPDGSANFSPATTHWFLTLHGRDAGDALAEPPPNFLTLQINPSNGHIKSYRP